LRDLIATRIGSVFSALVTDWFEETQGKLCWRVDVERSPNDPAFLSWKAQKKFYVREGPRTNDLDNESTYHYIKNKWG